MKHDSKTDSKVGRLKPTKLDKNGQENLLIPLDRHIDAIHRRAKKRIREFDSPPSLSIARHLGTSSVIILPNSFR